MFIRSKLRTSIVLAILIAVAPAAWAQDPSYDPPDRVARLSYQAGDVEFAPAGGDEWGLVDINRVLMAGDRLGSGDDARAELELGAAAVRLDRDSALSLVNLDDAVAQFELSAGTMDLRVRRLGRADTYEVDTPTLAFVAASAGNYRIDVGDDGSTRITVYSGAGTVYGDGGVSEELQAGYTYQFGDSQLQSADAYEIAPADAFDRFCAAREARYQRALARRYTAPDMIGVADLDGYGQWAQTAEYGAVWYPTDIPQGWAPYRAGHWIWVDPWGWTWVDNAAWGFAPFHYGRWAWIGGRWGWIPGPATARPVYAPALVAFVGGGNFSLSLNLGGGGPVGWFALGPRDVYQPPYRVTQNYFTNVNVTNVKVINTTIINNVYVNNYNNARPTTTISYANMKVAGAVTVVPRNVFTGARPVAAAAIAVKPEQLARVSAMPAIRIAPVASSLGVAAAARPPRPALHAFARPVVARTPPPPPAAPFKARAAAIAGQGGAPLAPIQLRQVDQRHAVEQPAPRIRLAAPMRGAAAPASPPPAPVLRRGLPPPKPPVTGERALPPARPAAIDRPLPVPAEAADGAANAPQRRNPPWREGAPTPTRPMPARPATPMTPPARPEAAPEAASRRPSLPPPRVERPQREQAPLPAAQTTPAPPIRRAPVSAPAPQREQRPPVVAPPMASPRPASRPVAPVERAPAAVRPAVEREATAPRQPAAERRPAPPAQSHKDDGKHAASDAGDERR